MQAPMVANIAHASSIHNDCIDFAVTGASEKTIIYRVANFQLCVSFVVHPD